MKVDWQPTHEALTASLTSASGTDLQIGTRIAAQLLGLGSGYDVAFTPEVDAQKVQGLAQNATDVARWASARSQSLSQIDSVAQWAEGIQVAANAVNPYLMTVAGQSFVLAPDVAVPFVAGETPATTATATIGDLHVVAREVGVLGNRVTVQVANHAPSASQAAALEAQLVGQPSEVQAALNAQIARLNSFFRIRFTLGSYAETFEPMQPGSRIPPSLLVDRVEWNPTPTRPTNAQVTLNGGTGRSLETVRARIRRAQTLPVLTAAQRELVGRYVTAVEQTAAISRPAPRFRGEYGRWVKAREDELLACMAKADAFVAAL